MDKRKWANTIYQERLQTSAIKQLSLSELFIDAATEVPNTPYLSLGNKTYSYHDTNKMACRIANAMIKHGYGNGSRIAVLIEDKIAYIASIHACLKIGAIAIPLNPNFTIKELTHVLCRVDYNLLLCSSDTPKSLPPYYLEQLIPAIASSDEEGRSEIPRYDGRSIAVLVIEHMLNEDNCAKEPNREVGSDDLAMILFTGGSLGYPKGCLLSNHNLLLSVQSWATYFGPGFQDIVSPRVFCAAPLYHIFGLVAGVFFTTLAKGTIVLTESLKASEVIAAFKKEQPHYFYAVPTTIIDMLSSSEFSTCNFLNLKMSAAGGAQLSVQIAEKYEAITQAPIVTGYGLSEAAGVVTGQLRLHEHKAGCVGLPCPGIEIMIANTKGESLPVGEIGEIYIRGQQIMKGYLEDKENSLAFTVDGWFKTGDTGFIDDGELYICGRIKEMILRSGFNVWPNEIDNVLKSYQGVEEACTVGVSDKRSGELIVSYIKQGEDAVVDLEALHAYCCNNLAKYKIPNKIVLIDSLPRTQTGKTDRKKLKDKAELST